MAPPASILECIYELFFWSGVTYQKFCSISVPSTFVGCLPDGFSHPFLVSHRKLVVLKLADALKTRGRRQALWTYTGMGPAPS